MPDHPPHPFFHRRSRCEPFAPPPRSHRIRKSTPPSWPTLAPLGTRLLLRRRDPAGFAAPAAAEVWKDGSGQFQVEAEFLGIRGTDVYLKKPNGMTIKVPLARLSAESQQLARQLAMPAAPAASGCGRYARRRGPSAAASMEAGNLRALWDALPASYQSDVNDLIHTFAANMDADVWRAGAGLLQKAIRVLKEKKEFILKQPALAQSPMDATTMAENWDPLVGVLETIATSELADLQKLKTWMSACSWTAPARRSRNNWPLWPKRRMTRSCR